MTTGPRLRIDNVYYRTGSWPSYKDWLVGFDYYVDNVRVALYGDKPTYNPFIDYTILDAVVGWHGKNKFNPKRIIKVRPGEKFKRQGFDKKERRGMSASLTTTAAFASLTINNRGDTHASHTGTTKSPKRMLHDSWRWTG